MIEIWKNVPTEIGYQVSNLGRVRSAKRTKIVQPSASGRASGHFRTYKARLLKPGRAKSGHLTVACGKGNSRYVHDLVLEAFVGPRPDGMECLHRDDVPSNNVLQNLRWGTRSENLSEAYANGRR